MSHFVPLDIKGYTCVKDISVYPMINFMRHNVYDRGIRKETSKASSSAANNMTDILRRCLLSIPIPYHGMAKTIMGRGKYENITPVLRDLHWLPIASRIHFKTLVLTNKCLHRLAPQYLSDLLAEYRPARTLRSTGQLFLVQPEGEDQSRR